MMRRAQPALGTLVEISLSDLGNEASRDAFQDAFASIHAIHRLMSFHEAASDIGRYNRASVGAILDIDTRTAKVLGAAQRVTELSDGLFDIRVANCLVALDYLPAPDASLPAYCRQKQAYRLLPGNQLEKLSADWLDVGGIAKGYAVDCAVAALQAHDVQHACVNAGGDLRVLGEPQAVGIRDPQQPQSMARQWLLGDRAMATSASYFSTKHVNDETVCALIDGRTGKAIQGGHSYTVLADECIWADALTKVLAASADVQHSCLRHFAAEAFII
ncbi:FAD:protein FMN transferase [Undibacterium sp. TS12]|uniref:FAD:protein FMN transferase n=1 Tax=Undibacterium sp. TS12 TaxID=2908202 RepID=UPI001F4D13CD|nr:FAD:protein FMN transferase [Undibacterium sp. TS12]MCH8619578.1 FAD:protein FMN transferase [Undibacterium sp. TS12]